jgi:processive 1,2-diacylglycerol beta-glucosyltransferase
MTHDRGADGQRPLRVLVLFCEEGEGHGEAARSLARELEASGVTAVTHDALRGGLGRLIPFFSRDTYRWQVRWLRWSYWLEYLVFARFPPGRALSRRGMALFGARPLRRLVSRFAPDLVVSTHPVVTNVLGHLRTRGRLSIPTVATITDFGVHALWANRGVDLHLVMHERALPVVERIAGARSALVVSAIVAPEFRSPRAKADARRAVGLPPDAPVALISGGGWGVGDVEAAVEAALAVPALTVVCLSGRNEVLHRRLEGRFGWQQRVRIVPFTDQMPVLLAAVDVLVDATVGVTCLEALTAGCRVIVFGAPPGHSRDNARALAALGLADRPRTRRELIDALTQVGSGQRPTAARLPRTPPAVEAILAAPLRDHSARRRRRRAAAAAAAVAGSVALAGWTAGSPTPYPVVAEAFHLEGLTRVQTSDRHVALIVEAPQGRIPTVARLLDAGGARASFAVAAVPSRSELASTSALGDSVLPELPPAGGVAAIHVDDRLRQLAEGLGLGHRFRYLRPRSGSTLGDYFAAKTAGGSPVSGTIWIEPGSRPPPALSAGSIVVLDARGPYTRTSLAALMRLLASSGLRALPLDDLLASAASARPTGAERASASAPPPVRSSATTSPASRQAEAGHSSPASTGASATGTNVVSAKTMGATCVTARRCRADISLSVPSPEAAFMARNHTTTPTHA